MESLRSYEAWSDSLRDFRWLLGSSLPGATDLDLMAERHGRYLVVEGKPVVADAVHLPLGQAIALRALAALDQFTVWLVAERGGMREGVYLLELAADTRGSWQNKRGLGFPLDRFQPLTVEQLRERASAWWQASSPREAA